MNQSHAAMALATVPYAGKVLGRDTIVALTQEVNPNLKAGSILPSDVDDFARDAEGHGLSNWKRDNPILFHRTGNGTYLVLPADERKTFAPSSGRGSSSGKTQAELIADARKLIADTDGN